MTAFRAGYKDGVQGRAYGWRNDDRWRDVEHDHYETGYTSGANDRAWKPDAREYHRDGTAERCNSATSLGVAGGVAEAQLVAKIRRAL